MLCELWCASQNVSAVVPLSCLTVRMLRTSSSHGLVLCTYRHVGLSSFVFVVTFAALLSLLHIAHAVAMYDR